MKIAELSIKRPTLVIVLFTLLILGGLFSYKNLAYELIPKFEINVVTISTVYPGAAPAEVENSVTRKIEDAVSSMENVKKLESRSYESLSVVTVELTSEADADYSLNDAQRKINAIVSDLPDDAETPSLSKFSLSDLPVVILGATSNLDEVAFYDLMDKKIEPMLARLPGVAQINLVGGQEREIQVNINQERLKGYGMSIAQVQNAILSSNLDFPTGSIKTRERNMSIRLSGKYRDVEELRNLVISSASNGAQIRVRDVADVQDTQGDIERVARLNQENTIVVQVIKQSDANGVAVSEAVKNAISTIQDSYKDQNLKLTIANDTSDFTLAAADSVIHDLFIAVLLVAFVMLFFLHSLRNAAITMVSIPASLIATFIGIYLLGYTLNLMTLLGLSLVVGILVDDAIVVLENIYRHMEMGKNKIRAAYDGASEIGFTVTAITLVIVVVFLPIAISTGLVANIVKQFCVVVIISTMLSLLASFTIVPWLMSRFGKLEHLTGKNFFERIILGFEAGLDKFTAWITGLLEWCLHHRAVTLSVSVFLLLGSCTLLGTGFIQTGFFPDVDRGQFLVQLELPKDASIEQTNALTQQVEEILSSKPEVVSITTTIGQASGDMGSVQATPYKSEINVLLVDKKQREDVTKIYAAKLKRELEGTIAGAKIKTIPVSIMGGAENAPVSLTVIGPDFDTAYKYAAEAAENLKKVAGASEVKLTAEGGSPEVNVVVDRDKMAALGLNMSTVGQTMRTAFNGNTDGKFRAGEYEYDINIRFDEFDRSNTNDIRTLTFINDRGQEVTLEQFAEIKDGSGPSLLERRDKSAAVTVQAQAVGKASGTITQEWEDQYLKSMEWPSGVSYIWGGDRQNQEEGFGTLGIALLAAIILVYLVMVALYDSFAYPFVVMFSIPLSFIGALVILAITNNSLNVFTILGMIMLIGLVAKNAILIVDFTNLRKAEGETTHNALVQANHARLRPILMTTIAMVFGMVPIALAKGAGAEMNNGLAWVIIGGLVSSLFLTLVIVPVVYSLVDGLLNRINKGKKPVDYELEMHAEFTPTETAEDGFTTKHH